MWKLTEEEDQYIVEMYNKMPAENRLKASLAVLDKMAAEKEDDEDIAADFMNDPENVVHRLR